MHQSRRKHQRVKHNRRARVRYLLHLGKGYALLWSGMILCPGYAATSPCALPCGAGIQTGEHQRNRETDKQHQSKPNRRKASEQARARDGRAQGHPYGSAPALRPTMRPKTSLRKKLDLHAGERHGGAGGGIPLGLPPHRAPSPRLKPLRHSGRGRGPPYRSGCRPCVFVGYRGVLRCCSLGG